MIVLAAILAVLSPLAKQSDYVFAKPALTNAIKGVVMGDVGSYATMRYEDAAFLTEALAERDYLTRTSVSSNEFNTVLTNAATVLKTPAISGLNLTANLDRFLDADCAASISARVVTSNAYTIEAWSMSTNVYPAVTNFIYQTMTNGVRNVWTNALPSVKSNVFVSATATKAPGVTDFCMANGIVRLSDTARFEHKTDGSPIIKALRGPYSRSNMTNIYSLVRRMRRAVPKAYNHTVTNDNILITGVHAVKLNGTVTGYTTTNSATGSYYYGSASRLLDIEDIQENTESDSESDSGSNSGSGDNDGEDKWHSLKGYPRSEDVTDATEKAPSVLLLTVETGLSDHFVTYGNHIRVRRADAFALVSTTYRKSFGSYHTVQDGTVTDSNTNLTQFGILMTPVGSATREEGHTNLTFKLEESKDIFKDAAQKLGFPFVTTNYKPSLPRVEDPDWDYDDPDNPTRRESKSHQYASETYEAVLTIYLILHLNPKTTISSWSECD